MKVSPNHVKSLFVVSVSKTANLDRLCDINKLGEIPDKRYLPFNNRAESCVILNAQQSIREGNSKMHYMRWACHMKALLGFFFFMNGCTEKAQCALSRVCIPKKRKRKAVKRIKEIYKISKKVIKKKNHAIWSLRW